MHHCWYQFCISAIDFNFRPVAFGHVTLLSTAYSNMNELCRDVGAGGAGLAFPRQFLSIPESAPCFLQTVPILQHILGNVEK